MFIKAIAKSIAYQAGLSPLQLGCVVAKSVASSLISGSIARELATAVDHKAQKEAMKDLLDMMQREQERLNDEPTDDTDKAVLEQ